MPLGSVAEVEVAVDNPVLLADEPELEGDEVDEGVDEDDEDDEDVLWACELASEDVEVAIVVDEDVDSSSGPVGLMGVGLATVLNEVVEVVLKSVLVEVVVVCDVVVVVVVVVVGNNWVEAIEEVVEDESVLVKDVVDEVVVVVVVVVVGYMGATAAGRADTSNIMAESTSPLLPSQT